MGIIDFLIGKSPKIFAPNGEVRHQHPDKKWKEWDNRYMKGAEYNWRNHVGMRAGASTQFTPGSESQSSKGRG